MQIENKGQANEIDANLIYKVTHNLKGPLNSIIGLSDIALSENKDDTIAIYLEKIKLSAEKLTLFIDDLLNLSKISATESAKTDKIFFQNIIDDILSSLQYLPNYKNMDVLINIQQYVDFYSDAVVLYSVMQNIIENSIKYYDSNKPYSFLKIRIYVTEESTKLEFEDNGIGIDEHHLNKVTEIFVRAAESSTGNGIGLFIVKKSIEKLNGTMQIESKQGFGTSTKLTFKQV